jgi:hypothetical protein
MRTLTSTLRAIHSRVGIVRMGDMIRVDDEGFWKYRSTPFRSLKEAARLFDHLKGETIVEVGTGLHGGIAGNSILVWSKKTSAKSIIAIDLDEQRINEVKAATSRYPAVKAIVADGISYLEQSTLTIDLLYLDFWVPDPEHTTPGTGRAEAYRRIYMAAKDRLNKHSLILIDDTDHVAPWKHTLIVPEARKDGYVVVYTGRQTLLQR